VLLAVVNVVNPASAQDLVDVEDIRVVDSWSDGHTTELPGQVRRTLPAVRPEHEVGELRLATAQLRPGFPGRPRRRCPPPGQNHPPL
jgi:hypothetical protein